MKKRKKKGRKGGKEEGKERREGGREGEGKTGQCVACLEDGTLLGAGRNASSYHWTSSFPAQLESGPCHVLPLLPPPLCWHFYFDRRLLPAPRGEQRDSKVLLASYANFSQGSKCPS